eukprot:1332085-Alexandrium_andersonii.AAC.1
MSELPVLTSNWPLKIVNALNPSFVDPSSSGAQLPCAPRTPLLRYKRGLLGHSLQVRRNP